MRALLKIIGWGVKLAQYGFSLFSTIENGQKKKQKKKWKWGEPCHNINKRAEIRIQIIASCVNFSKIWAKNTSHGNLKQLKYLILNGLQELPA